MIWAFQTYILQTFSTVTGRITGFTFNKYHMSATNLFLIFLILVVIYWSAEFEGQGLSCCLYSCSTSASQQKQWSPCQISLQQKSDLNQTLACCCNCDKSVHSLKLVPGYCCASPERTSETQFGLTTVQQRPWRLNKSCFRTS